MSQKLKLALLAALAIFLPVSQQVGDFGSGSPYEAAYYNYLGTPSTEIGLSDAYTGGGSASSTGRDIVAKPHTSFTVSYTPSSTGAILYLLPERATDPDCNNYFPLNTKQELSYQTNIYGNGTSTNNGIPYIFGDDGLTTASGTTYTFSFDADIYAQCIKISAKEYTPYAAGTVSVQGLSVSN